MSLHLEPANIPLSLYIHLPWCIRKCPYCDFNSHALPQQNLPEQAYITALIKDLKQDALLVGNRPVSSIFFGGGTPSLFSAEGIDQILQAVKAELNLSKEAEITLEANPGAIEQARFEGYRQAGVNRLSIGVQSFDPAQLKKLGRIHDPKQATRAAKVAKTAGFDNVNIDLMFGLPGQNIEQALDDLQQAAMLKPTHLSWYQLTLEPNTVFYRHPPILPDDELLWGMQSQGVAFLAAQGYQQYEISAYAQDNKICKHNYNYWQFGDYLGIGAGAHGKITLAEGEIMRTAKTRLPKDYLARVDNFNSEKKFISKQDLTFEFMLNALRLQQAISFDLFEQRTGLSRKILEPIIEKMQAKNLLWADAQAIHITDLGRRFTDDLIQAFLI